MERYRDLKEMLHAELERIQSKGELDMSILEQIDKIDLAASDDEDDEAAEAAAEAAAETGEEPPAVSGAVSVSGSEDIAADDDFEEFDPTE